MNRSKTFSKTSWMKSAVITGFTRILLINIYHNTCRQTHCAESENYRHKGPFGWSEIWDTLLNSASPAEFVGLFVSTTAYRLTLKCHCYSSLALWETIKNAPLNPIYKLSAGLCVHGKLHWVAQHIKETELHHLTMWPQKGFYIPSEFICKCSVCFTGGGKHACTQSNLRLRTRHGRWFLKKK